MKRSQQRASQPRLPRPPRASMRAKLSTTNHPRRRPPSGVRQRKPKPPKCARHVPSAANAAWACQPNGCSDQRRLHALASKRAAGSKRAKQACQASSTATSSASCGGRMTMSSVGTRVRNQRGVAGAHGNRTHRSRCSRLPTGFEGRAAHQHRSTPVRGLVSLAGSRRTFARGKSAFTPLQRCEADPVRRRRARRGGRRRSGGHSVRRGGG